MKSESETSQKYDFREPPSENLMAYVTDIWLDTYRPFKGYPAINYLEIGVGEGRSFFWMLDNILTSESSQAVAIDPFELYMAGTNKVQERFLHNLKVSGIERKVTFINDFSQNCLQHLDKDFFDVILIDGHLDAYQVIRDLDGSLPLLKKGGFITLDDYLWKSHTPEMTSPKESVDAWFKNHAELEILHTSYFILARKIT